jgi:chemotaxis signal transduction protein
MKDGGRVGGLLVRVDGALRFVPASIALRVAARPRVTPVPGAPAELVGIAIHEGVIVPVVAIGALRGEMIVCQHAGELVGLVGGEIVGTGSFDKATGRPEAILHHGQLVEPFDVAATYARVQASVRPGRWR